jgi:hypothetical protein
MKDKIEEEQQQLLEKMAIGKNKLRSLVMELKPSNKLHHGKRSL